MLIRRQSFAVYAGYDIATDSPWSFSIGWGRKKPRPLAPNGKPAQWQYPFDHMIKVAFGSHYGPEMVVR